MATARVPIRGWLLLFVLQAVSIVITNGYTVMRDAFRALLFSRSTTPSIHALTVFPAARVATAWVFVLLYVVGLTMIAIRSDGTRGYWLGALPAALVVIIIRLCMMVVEHERSLAHPIAPQIAGAPRPAVVSWPWTIAVPVVGGALVVVWWLYWARSKRVVRTFAPTAIEPEAFAA